MVTPHAEQPHPDPLRTELAEQLHVPDAGDVRCLALDDVLPLWRRERDRAVRAEANAAHAWTIAAGGACLDCGEVITLEDGLLAPHRADGLDCPGTGTDRHEPPNASVPAILEPAPPANLPPDRAALRDQIAEALHREFQGRFPRWAGLPDGDRELWRRHADAVLGVLPTFGRQPSGDEWTRLVADLHEAIARRNTAEARAERADRQVADLHAAMPRQADTHNADMTQVMSWQRRAETAEAKVRDYEHATNWGTSCTSCSRVLDAAHAQTVRAEEAEQQLAAEQTRTQQHRVDGGRQVPTHQDVVNEMADHANLTKEEAEDAASVLTQAGWLTVADNPADPAADEPLELSLKQWELLARAAASRIGLGSAERRELVTRELIDPVGRITPRGRHVLAAHDRNNDS